MGQSGVFWNTIFIIAFAAANGVLLMGAPLFSATTSIENVIDGEAWELLRAAVAQPTMLPWARVFGAQACMVGAFYLLTLAFGRPSRSFAFGSALMRVVWASLAVTVIALHDGPWLVAAMILAGDLGSAVHLYFAASSWSKSASESRTKPDGSPRLWRGPYWSGLLHMSLTAAMSILLLFDPYVIASLVNIFTSPKGPRHADVVLPASLQPDLVYGRLFAVFSLVVGLVFARHGPGGIVASVGSRLVLVAGTVAASAITLSSASQAAGGQGMDAGDKIWLLAPAISAALPSLISTPLCMLEHSIRAGRPDELAAVSPEQAAKDAHLD
jgi:hypothetical protein